MGRRRTELLSDGRADGRARCVPARSMASVSSHAVGPTTSPAPVHQAKHLGFRPWFASHERASIAKSVVPVAKLVTRACHEHSRFRARVRPADSMCQDVNAARIVSHITARARAKTQPAEVEAHLRGRGGASNSITRPRVAVDSDLQRLGCTTGRPCRAQCRRESPDARRPSTSDHRPKSSKREVE